MGKAPLAEVGAARGGARGFGARVLQVRTLALSLEWRWEEQEPMCGFPSKLLSALVSGATWWPRPRLLLKRA